MYLIEILHQTTTPCIAFTPAFSCILSKFYIKPQRRDISLKYCVRCILSKFYIKPQRQSTHSVLTKCCILSKFYIKPQRKRITANINTVVSYRNSTSNHNVTILLSRVFLLYLIEILHQTTTTGDEIVAEDVLYLIEILHQTTTPSDERTISVSCILSKFYIKPQRETSCLDARRCCILSKFYIKPQPTL